MPVSAEEPGIFNRHAILAFRRNVDPPLVEVRDNRLHSADELFERADIRIPVPTGIGIAEGVQMNRILNGNELKESVKPSERLPAFDILDMVDMIGSASFTGTPIRNAVVRVKPNAKAAVR